MSYYITGDCHADFNKVDIFCRNYKTSKSDVMIVLGDAGLNYSLDMADDIRKQEVNDLPITCFMVHGNHEERPYNIDTYKEMEWHDGIVYYEEKYPNLLFAKDGEIYDLDGKKAIVIGGAYSVDKKFRLQCGYSWFESEQPTPEIKAYVEAQLEKVNWKVDYVFSHTCPLVYEPTDLFLSGIDQSKVDKSTEQWLSTLNEKLSYETWYFGHYHDNRAYLKSEMLFEGIKELGKEEFLQKVGKLDL